MECVYLLCHNVDNGYHVDGAYYNEQRCMDEVERLNKKYESQKIKDLQAIGYSLEDAKIWLSRVSDEYFMEEHILR